MMRHSGQQSGFTLVELIIALTLTAAMLAASLSVSLRTAFDKPATARGSENRSGAECRSRCGRI